MANQKADSLTTLVVDDQKTMRSIVRTLLGEIGICEVYEAENGEQALGILQDTRLKVADLVFCDLHMDKMDGMEFCNRLHRDKMVRNRNIPVIMLTGDADTFVHEVAE